VPVQGVRISASGHDTLSISVPAGAIATQPAPKDGATGLRACEITQLSWTNPEPNQPGDTITSTVFLGSEPNACLGYEFWADYDMVQLPDDDNTDNVVAVSLEDDKTYYWRVDCSDPSAGVTQGMLWSFDTIWSLPDLVADFDSDKIVGFTDFLVLAGDWLENCSWADMSPAPLGDGSVDFSDFSAFAAHWRQDNTGDMYVTFDSVVSDNYKSTQLNWKYGIVRRSDVARGFGLALPHQYDPQSDTLYPLVLYLHGAGARGSQITQVLHRQTAREFAFYGQTDSRYAAFVLAPQVPSGEYWAGVHWTNGPYDQTEATYTDTMKLTDGLLAFLVDANNNPSLAAFGLDANDIDTERIYVVGDSMGSYGTWDIVGRHPGLFAAAIASAGSGPKNRLTEILETPFWAIHGIADTLVPNALPSVADPDGAGSLGMLAMMDQSFDNTASTNLIKLDDYTSSSDDPVLGDHLIYTQFPSHYGHATVAMEWTTLVPGVKQWLFEHYLGPPPLLITIAPATSFEATGDGGMVLSINEVSVDDMILGTTTFPNPPHHSQFPPEYADDFDLSTASSGDNQPYVKIMYDQPVTTIFIAENGGNDTGYAQALDVNGEPIGGVVAWGSASYLNTGYIFLSQQGYAMAITAVVQPIYGVQFLPPDEGSLGIDPMSAPALPAESDGLSR
jgi:pimeloyl-ACP methyl ester carboxylesterase